MSMKQRVVVRGPALTQSGYGEHTRMVLRSLRSREDLFDVYILPTNWGHTGWTSDNDDLRQWVDERIKSTQEYHNLMAQHKQPPSYDVSLQVAIPNEWEKIAPVNIRVTAGIETTKVAPEWLMKANEMDKIIITSTHSKEVFENTTYEGTDNTGAPATLSLNTPIEVVGYPARNLQSDEDLELELEYDFNYIFVGQWGPRKNIDNMIRWWLEECWEEPVGLVLKTSHRKNNLKDRNFTLGRIKHILKSTNLDEEERKCKLYLLHGDLKEKEIISIYRHPKVKCMITATHGEGFGLPLFDFAQVGKPIVAPEWSAHLDFLVAESKSGKKIKPFLPVSYDLAPVPEGAVWKGVIQEDSMWAYPHEGSFKHRLRQARKNKKWLQRAQDHIKNILSKFDEATTYARVVNLVHGEEVDIDDWLEELESDIVEYE